MGSTTFVLAILSLVVGSWTTTKAHRHVPAIYVFGDSTADVGNNNYLSGNAKGNFPPFGIDYPGAIPTGRFCNGYVAVDFMAMRMGFKKSPPAALSVKKAVKESRGVSYASGASGILDQTGKNVSISMNSQIGLFRKRVSRLEKAKGKRHARVLLSKSIFVFSTVSNDLFAFFRSDPIAAANATLQDQYISSLSTKFEQQLQILHGLGARKMVVFGTSQLGCLPASRRPSPTGDCYVVLNDISKKFNIAMKEKMRALSSMLEGLKYSYINSYDIYGSILDRASEFGFKEIKSACCGSGFLNAETPCTPNSIYCANRDEFLSWDSLHPTQATYKRTVDLAYNALPRFVEPISLYDLVR